ncbi:hypothetical protein KAW80_03650 [Candidatus Babeliales bacterium]|nr:hypothetical protein [Candidatus Babeliales bacterium]
MSKYKLLILISIFSTTSLFIGNSLFGIGRTDSILLRRALGDSHSLERNSLRNMIKTRIFDLENEISDLYHKQKQRKDDKELAQSIEKTEEKLKLEYSRLAKLSSGALGKIAAISFLGHDTFNDLENLGLWDDFDGEDPKEDNKAESQDSSNPKKPKKPSKTLRMVGYGLVGKSVTALGKPIDSIIQNSVGIPLERLADWTIGVIGNVLFNLKIGFVRLVSGVDGSPFDYLCVDDLNQVVFGIIDGYLETLKGAKSLGARDYIERAQKHEAPDVLEKVDEIVFNKVGINIKIGSHLKKHSGFTELGIDGVSKSQIFREVEKSFDIEITLEDEAEIACFTDLLDFIQADSDWREERNLRLKELSLIIAYFDSGVSYYSKNKNSMEYRFGVMIRDSLKEFASLLYKAKSFEDLGTSRVEGRLKRLRSSFKKNCENLLKYISYKKSDDNKEKTEKEPQKLNRHSMMDSWNGGLGENY